MKTSSFFIYQGPGRISIARYAPRGIRPGFRIYKQLAPLREMLKMPYPAYRDLYFSEILGKLDPQQTWKELHALAGMHEPVLLCWERLHNPSEWCHRRMVAEWFERHLGVEVSEYNPESDQLSLGFLLNDDAEGER